MKSRPLFIILVAALLAGASTVALFKRRQFEKNHLMNNMEVIWNSNEMFAIVGMKKEVIRESIAETIWRRMKSLVSSDGGIASTRLVLWHINNDEVRRFEFEGIDPGGGMFPYHGVMHYSVGVQDPAAWPALWRWTGSNLEKVEKTNAESIIRSFSTRDQIIVQEGWNQQRLPFKEGETPLEVSLGTNRLMLVLGEMDSGSVEERSLLLHSGGKKQVLIESNSSFKLK